MAPKEAPWKATFLLHLNAVQDANAEAQLSLATVTTPSKLPRVRSVGHAGFWSVTAAASATTFTSSCPTFVTDSRSNKVAHIFGQTDHLLDSSEVYGFGSGGGGPVEAVYWLQVVKMQWRVRGRCFFVVDGQAVASTLREDDERRQERRRRKGLAVTKAAVRPHMCAVVDREQVDIPKHDDDINVDSIWEAEVQGYYQRLSSDVQKSFLRSSFTVGTIVPDEVEMMDLTDAAVARRRIWKCTLSNGVLEWKVIWDNI